MKQETAPDPASLWVVGFLNVVGRQESPQFEHPVLQDGSDGGYWLSDADSDAECGPGFSPVALDDLKAAERNGRMTWLERVPYVENGLILVAEEPADVEKGLASPALACLHVTREDAQPVLNRLGNAYFQSGVGMLGGQTANLEVATDYISRSFRCRPDNVAALILLWQCAKLVLDDEGAAVGLELLEDALGRCVVRSETGVPTGMVTRVRIDCDAQLCTLGFDNGRESTIPGAPERVAVEMLVAAALHCERFAAYSQMVGLMLGLGVQVLLSGVLSGLMRDPSDRQAPAEPILADVGSIHLNNDMLKIELALKGRTYHWNVVGLEAIKALCVLLRAPGSANDVEGTLVLGGKLHAILCKASGCWIPFPPPAPGGLERRRPAGPQAATEGRVVVDFDNIEDAKRRLSSLRRDSGKR